MSENDDARLERIKAASRELLKTTELLVPVPDERLSVLGLTVMVAAIGAHPLAPEGHEQLKAMLFAALSEDFEAVWNANQAIGLINRLMTDD